MQAQQLSPSLQGWLVGWPWVRSMLVVGRVTSSSERTYLFRQCRVLAAPHVYATKATKVGSSLMHIKVKQLWSVT